MNLYRHSKKSNRGPYVVAITLILFVFVLDLALGGGMRGLLREGSSRMWSAVSAGTDAITQSGLFSTRRALLKENNSLKERIAELTIQAAAFEVLKQENQALRTTARLVEGEKGVSAPIVSSFHTSPYGTFLIGAGAQDGIAKGNIVMAGDPTFGGFVVGRIEEVHQRTALVKGLFAPGETTNANIDGIGVTLKGHGGGQARGEAPREAVIEVGDVVTFPEAGGKAIGIVGNVEKDLGGASTLVYVHLPFALTALTYLYVIPE